MEVRCRTTYKLHRYMIEIKYNSRNVQSMEKSDHYQRAIDPSSLGEHYYTNEKIAAASLRACVHVCLNKFRTGNHQRKRLFTPRK